MKKYFAGAAIALLLLFNIYNLISTGSRIFKTDQLWTEIAATKSDSFAKLIRALDNGEDTGWLADYAPVIRWHPEEKYKSTDPQEVLATATLWYREINKFLPFIDDEVKDFGAFNPSTFKTVVYKGATPADDVTRLMETGGLDKGYSGFEIRYDSFMTPKLPAPFFWRISRHPLFKEVQTADKDHLYLPVEFWYHFNYNDTRWYFGNHDGDWESVLFVFEAKVVGTIVTIKPFVVSISAHGGSSWHCEKNLSHLESRVQLYNALGTHATYAEPGNHWRLIYPDKTAEGDIWETWKLMRPVEKENFYGFSGSWGRTSYVYFQNAPIAPGPHFKYLPADANIERATNDFRKIVSKCSGSN